MKKLISIILTIALSATTVCALCSCAPPLPQLIRDIEAYYDYKIIDDKDLMNIACIAGNGPLRITSDEKQTEIYEPIEFTPTVKLTQISNDELQAIADELFGDDDSLILNENLFIYFFGEYHGYYALGIYGHMKRFDTLIITKYSVGDIAWDMPNNSPYYLYIYTTPEKTKI